MHPSITAAYLARYRSVVETAGGSAQLLPLTGAQRRFLLVRRLDPQGRPDVVPLFFAFPRGTVDVPRLRRAATDLARRHPALRGTVSSLRGAPVLRLGTPSAEVTEIPVAPGESAEDALRRELLAWAPAGPPLRLLLAAGPDAREELLAVALDHAACDEQSLGIVTAALSEAYEEDAGAATAEGRETDEGGVAAYREAVERQLAAETAASTAGAHAHWAGRLGRLAGADAAPATAAPAPTAAATTAAPAATGMLSHRLPAASAAARSAVFPALLDAVSAAAQELLGPGRPLALGYPWGGRPAGAPPALGCFLNTLVHPATTGCSDLDDLSAAWWDDLDHADTPFDEVVHAARSAGASWTGALDGLLTFEDLHRRPPLVLGGTPGRETHLAGRPLAAPFAVSASHGEDLLVRLAWDRGRCSEAAAEDAFDALLGTMRRHLGGANGANGANGATGATQATGATTAGSSSA